MSFLDRIRACNTHDLSGFRRFELDGQSLGWIRHALAEDLAAALPGFVTTPHRLTMAPEVVGFAARSALLDRAARRLVGQGVIAPLRGEHYPVGTGWGVPPLAQLDRAAVAVFGTESYGLHVNGFVRGEDGGLSLWIATRARDRAIAPGQFDNMVAGGQPVGLSLADNLLKEAHEEAGLDAALVRRATPVGALRYCLETPEGLKRDRLFLYDLELPSGVTPVNTDGEVESFALWPVERVAESVRTTGSWKFNVNLVIVDFLIRHGCLTPENEPDYLTIIDALRPPPPA
jgi:8-oxo-dGTP pyrophosphatase MutT (NUDIX family)